MTKYGGNSSVWQTKKREAEGRSAIPLLFYNWPKFPESYKVPRPKDLLSFGETVFKEALTSTKKSVQVSPLYNSQILNSLAEIRRWQVQLSRTIQWVLHTNVFSSSLTINSSKRTLCNPLSKERKIWSSSRWYVQLINSLLSMLTVQQHIVNKCHHSEKMLCWVEHDIRKL